MDVTQFVEVYPNARVKGPLVKEFTFLPLVADLAKTGKVRLVTHAEVRMALWGLPKTDDAGACFRARPSNGDRIHWNTDAS
jgi:hypothetical protein